MKHQDRKPHVENSVSWPLVLNKPVMAKKVEQQAWWRTQEAERVNWKQGEALPFKGSITFPNSAPNKGPIVQIWEPLETLLIQTTTLSPTESTQRRNCQWAETYLPDVNRIKSYQLPQLLAHCLLLHLCVTVL